MEDKDKNWVVNLTDPAVRSVCVAIDGEALPPYVPPAAPAAATSIKDKKSEVRVYGVALKLGNIFRKKKNNVEIMTP